MKSPLLGWSTFGLIAFLSLIKLLSLSGVALALLFVITGLLLAYVTFPWQQRNLGWMGVHFGIFAWVFGWPLMLPYCLWCSFMNITTQTHALENASPVEQSIRRLSSPKRNALSQFKHPQVLSLSYQAKDKNHTNSA